MLLSPEAEVALGAWVGIDGRVGASLEASASGRELADLGFAEDVTIAAEVDASEVVPVLEGGAFRGHPVD
jgi:2-phosphosulfolactate phosphatase